MQRTALLATAILLTGCDESAAPKKPTPMSVDAKARLAKHADPSSWQELDGDRPGHRLRDPRSGIVFVRVPAGEFEMGSDTVDSEKPRHRVVLTRDYLMAATELTVGQWRHYVQEYAGDPNVEIPEGGDDLPMTLSFADAIRFAETMSYRLPTEAEWERACGGGVARDAEPWNTEKGMRAAAWFHRNANYRSHPVGQKAPNGYGLHDMLGNLWEWCVDGWNRQAYAGRKPGVEDPVGSTKAVHRVIRGGSWFSTPPGTPRTRLSAHVDERTPFFGARFAATAPPIR